MIDVNCPWEVSETEDSVMISVKVDWDGEIMEIDENNNQMNVSFSIEDASVKDAASSKFSISSGFIWIFTIVLLVLIILLFKNFGPKGIKTWKG